MEYEWLGLAFVFHNRPRDVSDAQGTQFYSLSELSETSDELIKEWGFSAALNYATPLKYLLRHGETSNSRETAPRKFGILTPIPNPGQS